MASDSTMSMKQWTMELLLMLVLFSMVEAFTPTTLLHDLRQLQQPQALNYRANYTADFQYLLGANCAGDPPVVQVSCFGTGMTILNTTDETLVCTQLAVPQFVNGITYECQFPCNDTATPCTTVATSVSLTSILFICESDDVREVEASFLYLAGNSNGTCQASADEAQGNLHVARLGVSCPVAPLESSREYVYDDTYFECKPFRSIPFDFATDDQDPDVYGCVNGQVCGAQSCNFAFYNLQVSADVPSFIDACVETIIPVEDITSFPTSAPGPTSAFVYSVRFEGSWAQLYNSEESRLACSDLNPTIVVSCENGASIEYVTSTDVSMNCTEISNSVIQCIDANNIAGQFTSVFYDCIGTNLPTSRVTYPGSSVFCEGNDRLAVIQHAVTLGVYCTVLLPDDPYYFSDAYFECSESTSQFKVLSDDTVGYGFNSTVIRHSCSASATFPFDSSSSNPKSISNVAITTDDYWISSMDDGCFAAYKSAAPVPMTNAPSTPTPTIQITSSPTLFPSLPPTDAPTMQPTTPPVAAVPTMKPATPPVAAVPIQMFEAPLTSSPVQSPERISGTLIGGVIGGIAGAAVILALVGFIVFQRKADSTNSKKPDVGSSQWSSVEGTAGGNHDSSLGPPPMLATPQAYPAPDSPTPTYPAPVSPAPPTQSADYQVHYKDQSRTVVAAAVVAENVPFAVALDTSAESGGSKSRQSEPPGRVSGDATDNPADYAGFKSEPAEHDSSIYEV